MDICKIISGNRAILHSINYIINIFEQKIYFYRMEKFQKLQTTAVPLPLEDIDTDQIIPARFLKATSREGFGDNLFRDWRYTSDDNVNSQFILNNPKYSGEILLAGKNFGCGSSREHAAWALYDYGFRVVVSSFFADIFRNNALNNGLLPITVSAEDLNNMMTAVQHNPDTKFVVDLDSQILYMDQPVLNVPFDINSYKKTCLINGYDDMDYLLSMKDKIVAYEKAHV